jgi:hypothetical protein
MRQDAWQAGQWLAFRQVVDADPIRDPYFQLAGGSPIYAMAPGQLVAARLGNLPSDANAFHRNDPASANPTTLFVLLRHEVFY